MGKRLPAYLINVHQGELKFIETEHLRIQNLHQISTNLYLYFLFAYSLPVLYFGYNLYNLTGIRTVSVYLVSYGFITFLKSM